MKSMKMVLSGTSEPQMCRLASDACNITTLVLKLFVRQLWVLQVIQGSNLSFEANTVLSRALEPLGEAPNTFLGVVLAQGRLPQVWSRNRLSAFLDIVEHHDAAVSGPSHLANFSI